MKIENQKLTVKEAFKNYYYIKENSRDTIPIKPTTNHMLSPQTTREEIPRLVGLDGRLFTNIVWVGIRIL